MCRPLGIHTTFTSRNTLRKSLTKVKGRPGMLDVKGVVYSIPCADCPATYIAQRKWMAKTVLYGSRDTIRIRAMRRFPYGSGSNGFSDIVANGLFSKLSHS